MEQPIELPLVAPQKAGHEGTYHFAACPLLSIVGKDLRRIYSHAEAEREHLQFCDKCAGMEKYHLWKVIAPTQSMPSAGIGPRQWKLFAINDRTYHKDIACPVLKQETDALWNIPGVNPEKAQKAFPIKPYENVEDARWANLEPCPHCVDLNDPDIY